MLHVVSGQEENKIMSEKTLRTSLVYDSIWTIREKNKEPAVAHCDWSHHDTRYVPVWFSLMLIQSELTFQFEKFFVLRSAGFPLSSLEQIQNCQRRCEMRPKIVLFGDSITEESFGEGGWGASLAHLFARWVSKAGIVFRSFFPSIVSLIAHDLIFLPTLSDWWFDWCLPMMN